MSEEEGVGFSGTRLGRSGATDGLTRRRGTPASGPPRGPATCRSGGAPSGTLGRRASGAPGTAGNPIRSAPLGRAIPRGGPPAGGPRGPTSVLAFAALPDGVRDHPADVEGGHVLFRQPEGLLVRHPALFQGLVEVRDRGAELRGRVFAVDRVREAVQQRGDLLRESLEEFLHFICVHHSVFFLTHFLHRPCLRSSRGWSRYLSTPSTCDHLSATSAATRKVRVREPGVATTIPCRSRSSSRSRTIRREAVPRLPFTASVIWGMLRAGRSNHAAAMGGERSSFRPGITKTGDTLSDFASKSAIRK